MAGLLLKWGCLAEMLLLISSVRGQYTWPSVSSVLESSSGSEGLPIGQSCHTSMGNCKLDQELLLDSEIHRRTLSQIQLYISYDSLSADRVPCPPGSGRSYYTPNCRSATGPVNPYTRGCSAIARCARVTSS